MPELVRLVIWDLDETFWKGTLTEGGIREYVKEHHDIVVELAHRGIMSSICSKNEESAVFPILSENGILDYFIFPSISWDAKGPRIATLVELVQLRPDTIMFIDDNPNNRAEAADFVPGIQVEDEKFLNRILLDKRFVGKDDRSLSRLNQYKLLENRKIDESKSGIDNESFLRNCNIRIIIDYNVENNIDRAIELINRTNQLNYTKLRLPEDPENAKIKLISQLNGFNKQAGLIRVVDNYGDYGYVGFFLMKNQRKNIIPNEVNKTLIHYCFSCRTLGMYVEKWMYEYLGRPEINVVGEVLTDLNETKDIDWITIVRDLSNVSTRIDNVIPKIVLWGGCEANSLDVYLKNFANNVNTIANFSTNNCLIKVDSAVHVLSACHSNPNVLKRESEVLGIPVSYLSNNVFYAAPRGSVFIFSFDFDAYGASYMQHRKHGNTIFMKPEFTKFGHFLETSHENVFDEIDSIASRSILERKANLIDIDIHFRKNYVRVDRLDEETRLQHVRDVIELTPAGSKFIVIAHHFYNRPKGDEYRLLKARKRWSELMSELVKDYDFAAVARFTDVIRDKNEVLVGPGGVHYERQIYLRFAEHIVEICGNLAPRAESDFGTED